MTVSMEILWGTRRDLQALFDIETAEGQEGLIWWYYLEAPKDLGPQRRIAASEIERVAAPDRSRDAMESGPDTLPVTHVMRRVWDRRPDLQDRFRIDTPHGSAGFVWWYCLHGATDLGSTWLISETDRGWLSAPDPKTLNLGAPTISRIMRAAWEERPDLRQAFDLGAKAGQTEFFCWFIAVGLKDFPVADLLSEDQRAFLNRPVPGSPGLCALHLVLHRGDPALQSEFPDARSRRFHMWLRSPAAQERYPALGILESGSRQTQWATAALQTSPKDLAFGVNIVGYAHGQLGIGEDVRMAARACEAVGLPFSIFNVKPGKEISEGDESLAGHVSPDRPYAVDVFCLTGFETARLAVVHGSELFDGRQTIGYWPWEFPEWPAEWRHAYGLISEVWASSRFLVDTYAESNPNPTRYMPMAVTVTETEELDRRAFGLPKDIFLFVFSFDLLSSLARKNPIGVIIAFRLAFPDGNEPVGLVLKVMRPDSTNPAWREIVRLTKDEPRIHLVTATLGRGGVLDLYRICDCFVSLHRSEGFGRGMAEAMLLDTPVIATAWSGNLDITTEETALLVPAKQTSVGKGDYLFGENLIWGEPNLAAAATQMRRMVQEPELRSRLCANAKKHVIAQHGLVPVGERYLQVIKELLR